MAAMNPGPSRHRPSPVLQAAALGQALTALVLARQWSTSEDRTTVILLGAVLLASLAGAWALWLRDAFETRTVVGMVACAVAVGVGLALSVGMPGGEGGHVTPTYLALGALATGVLALLGVDTWQRTRSRDG